MLVAAAILVVFFVPFPRLSVFDRLSHQTSTSPGVSSTTTTTRPRVSNATTKQIDAFVARASHGLSERFRASYEITEPVAGGRTSSSLENVAQLSYPQHFMYERYGGGSGHLSEFFFGPTQSPRDAGTFGIYTCAAASLRASWSCGLLGEGMAGSMLMADYLPAAMFTGLQALAGQGSAVAFDRIVAGRQMSCLKFGSGNAGEGGTVCLTAGGVIGYESSQLVSNPEFEGTATLRTLSFDVLPEQLDLPATVFVARCRSEGLRVSAHQASGAVGSEAVLIVFENASVSSCEMKGYPTAWFVSSSGKRLGPKSGHESAPAPSTVFLPPGDTASATVWTRTRASPSPPTAFRSHPPVSGGAPGPSWKSRHVHLPQRRLCFARQSL